MIEKHGINPTTLGEVGCGAGEIIKQLWISLDCKADSKGFEISKQAYEICQKKQKIIFHIIWKILQIQMSFLIYY